MSHWSGNRTGFNQRGGSVSYHLEIVHRVQRQHEDRARNAYDKLIALWGMDKYREWSQSVWPGDSIDLVSWEEIANTVEAALKQAQGQANNGGNQ